MPRGYGGTAILSKKQTDHVIKPLDVCGNQIKCVAMNVCEPLLLISVYMPRRWITDNYTEFKDTLDQLSVILSQYAPTHQIIIGGDLNEDITLSANGAMAQYLREFIVEHELKTQPTKPTFINPAGAEVSTIDDYFLYSHTLSDSTCITSLRRLDTVITNVSDHYPIELTFEVSP